MGPVYPPTFFSRIRHTPLSGKENNELDILDFIHSLLLASWKNIPSFWFENPVGFGV